MTKARDLSNIISGGFTADDIPSLDTAKITSGTFAAARIDNNSLSNVTALPFSAGTVLTTQGDILYRDGSGLQRLGVGTAGQALLVNSGATAVEWGNAGGANTPSFGAKLSSNQSLTGGTFIKMQLATELWDTDSAFDNSTNYRFTVPSDKAGRYMFVGSGNIGDISDGGEIRMFFYKNGSVSNQGNIRYFAAAGGVGIYFTSSAVIDLSVGDYIELYQYTSGGNHFSASETYLYGYKIIE